EVKLGESRRRKLTGDYPDHTAVRDPWLAEAIRRARRRCEDPAWNTHSRRDVDLHILECAEVYGGLAHGYSLAELVAAGVISEMVASVHREFSDGRGGIDDERLKQAAEKAGYDPITIIPRKDIKGE